LNQIRKCRSSGTSQRYKWIIQEVPDKWQIGHLGPSIKWSSERCRSPVEHLVQMDHQEVQDPR
jgi:hypothetical protein